jgi:hypothetical protein
MWKYLPVASLAVALSLCICSCGDDDAPKTTCQQACAKLASCGVSDIAETLQACDHGNYFLDTPDGSCHECKAECYAKASCSDLEQFKAGPDNPISNSGCISNCYR